jgi:hypothetical protein
MHTQALGAVLATSSVFVAEGLLMPTVLQLLAANACFCAALS